MNTTSWASSSALRIPEIPSSRPRWRALGMIRAPCGCRYVLPAKEKARYAGLQAENSIKYQFSG